MNRDDRITVEASMRSLRFKLRLLEDSYESNTWLCGAFTFGACGGAFLGIILAPVFWVAAFLSFSLAIAHGSIARGAGKKIDAIEDRLVDEQVKLIMNRTPSTDRHRDT